MELLPHTHFLNSEVTEETAVTVSVRRARCCDWRVTAMVVTCRRVEWTIDSFAHTKVQEWMTYSRPCFNKDGELLSFTLSG